MSPRSIVVSGGGTGGHIYPALAIAEEMLKRHPNMEIHYVGRIGGREETLSSKSDLPITFHGIHAANIPRKLSTRLFATIWENVLGMYESRRLLKIIQPDVVIGTGGYVSGTTVKMAQRMGIPTLIHESDAIPGITNRLLGRKANIVTTSYAQLVDYFGKKKVHVTGNPLRGRFDNLNREEGLKAFRFESGQPVLLVFGGSQGSLSINQNVVEALDLLEKRKRQYQVIFQTGEKGYLATTEALKNVKGIKLVIQPFIYNMAQAYAASDLVIARSGAISLSEIAACGLPSILIPYPHATANHQEKNARAVENAGAAKVILEKDLSPIVLAELIDSLVMDLNVKQKMSEASRNLGKPNATKAICDLIESLMKSRRQ